eukprot:scaffold134260_cov115-Phaeocystis_antarctica.AAC.1
MPGTRRAAGCSAGSSKSGTAACCSSVQPRESSAPSQGFQPCRFSHAPSFNTARPRPHSRPQL